MAKTKIVSSSELTSVSLRARDYIELGKPPIDPEALKTYVDALYMHHMKVLADLNNAVTPISLFLDELNVALEEPVDTGEFGLAEALDGRIDAHAGLQQFREIIAKSRRRLDGT